MPLSTSRAIAVTFTGLPANTSTTWQVGTSTTSPLYSGRCFINAEGSVTLYLDDILRDYLFRWKPVFAADGQAMQPNVLITSLNTVVPHVDNADGTFWSTVCTVRVNYSGTYATQQVTVIGSWDAPTMGGDYESVQPMILGSVGTDVLPHIPGISTEHFWIGLMFFMPSAYYDARVYIDRPDGQTSHQISLQSGLGGHYYAAAIPLSVLQLGSITPVRELIYLRFEKISGGTTTQLRRRAALVDYECVAPYYVSWITPNGGWMSQPMWGNVTFAGGAKASVISDLGDVDRVVGGEAQPLFTLHSGYVKRDVYDVLSTLAFARYAYVFDTQHDRGCYCTVQNRSLSTMPSQSGKMADVALQLTPINHIAL